MACCRGLGSLGPVTGFLAEVEVPEKRAEAGVPTEDKQCFLRHVGFGEGLERTPAETPGFEVGARETPHLVGDGQLHASPDGRR